MALCHILEIFAALDVCVASCNCAGLVGPTPHDEGHCNTVAIADLAFRCITHVHTRTAVLIIAFFSATAVNA